MNIATHDGARSVRCVKTLLFGALLLVAFGRLRANAASTASIQGTIANNDGTPVANATIRLYSVPQDGRYEERTSPIGTFHFTNVAPGEYKISVELEGRTCAGTRPIVIPESRNATIRVQLCSEQQPLQVLESESPAFEKRLKNACAEEIFPLRSC